MPSASFELTLAFSPFTGGLLSFCSHDLRTDSMGDVASE
jgi:hypothetical protein